MAKHKPAIAYYRVSTAKQGAEGNGIEAQRAAVERLGGESQLRCGGEVH